MIIKQWIIDNLEPTKSLNYNYSAYNFKHMAERQTGVYISEDDFVELMISLDYMHRTKNHRTLFNVTSKIHGKLNDWKVGRL